MEDYKKSLLSDTKKLINTDVLKMIIDREPLGIAVYKPIKNKSDLLHVYINPAYQALNPGVQILGRPVAEVWPELTDVIRGLVDQVFEDGDKVEIKDVQLSAGNGTGKNAKMRYLTFILSPISIDSEDRVLAAVIDTTGEVQSRKSLIFSEEQYRLALKNSPVIASRVTNDLRYAWASNPHPAFDPVTVIGKRDDELAPADWVSELIKFKESVLKSGIGDRKIVAVTVQGQPRYYDVTAEPLFDYQGEVRGLSTAAIDITDLKNAQEALKKQAEQLNILHEIATVATSSLDVSRVSDRVLKSLAKVFGLSTATIFAVDKEKDMLFATALWGYSLEFFQSIADIKINSEYQSAETFRIAEPIFFEDISAADVPESTRIAAEKIEEITHKKIKSNMTLPLIAYGGSVGVIALTWPDSRAFTNEDIEFLTSIAHEIAIGLENARLFEKEQVATKALKEKDASIRQAYTDVIDSVTGGKLILMTLEEIGSALGRPVMDMHTVSRPEELKGARQEVRNVLAREFNVKDPAKFIDPFGEALTNAVKHAGGGNFQVFRIDNTVQVKVADSGPGIDFSRLPKATLAPGYSSIGTLGLGFTVMLNRADRLLLSTQPGNTTVVLETSL